MRPFNSASATAADSQARQYHHQWRACRSSALSGMRPIWSVPAPPRRRAVQLIRRFEHLHLLVAGLLRDRGALFRRCGMAEVDHGQSRVHVSKFIQDSLPGVDEVRSDHSKPENPDCASIRDGRSSPVLSAGAGRCGLQEVRDHPIQGAQRMHAGQRVRDDPAWRLPRQALTRRSTVTSTFAETLPCAPGESFRTW